jgi:hypothetical protein
LASLLPSLVSSALARARRPAVQLRYDAGPDPHASMPMPMPMACGHAE